MSNIIPSSPLLSIDTEKGNSPLAPEMAHGTKLAERKKRTRTGCLNCSRRRRKCDEAKPTCTGCKRRGEDCQWRMLGSFRDANIKVLESDHPSMSQGGAVSSKKSQSRFKILNNLPNLPRTRGVKRQFEAETVLDLSLSEAPGLSPSPSPSTNNNKAAAQITDETAEDHQTYVDQANHTSDPSPNQTQALSPLLSGHSHITQDPCQSPCHNNNQESVCQISPHDATDRCHFLGDLQCDFEPPSLHGDASSIAYLNTSPEFVIDDLNAIRNLTPNSQFQPSVSGSYQSHSPLFNHNIFSDPTDFTDDVFLPGSTYEALHTTLRNRQLWTARPDITSLCSPRGSISHIHTPTPFSDSDTFNRPGREHWQSRPGRFIDLSPEREHTLWQNYLNEICSWLDMFDNNHHFASTFPQMAKAAPHLRYSILALSARQLERLQNNKSQSESLSLYQEAIHLLLPELENKTIPVIASCVILCVLEMLSCNPKEWRRHLDGCAYLIQAAGINGFSGKEEQALFWCFARMDLCGGLISEEETIIPIHNWRPRDMSCVEASLVFLSSAKTNFDTYANYTVYLCAETLAVLFGTGSKTLHPCTSCQSVTDEEGNSYVRRWQEVFSHADLWYENRPSQMKPIFTVAVAKPGYSGRNRPFPTVLYGNGDAISGNQLYHKSVLWHARQICAISASNEHHGCWTNALQPLWIAGKVMSHYSEHAAIVDTLVRIEHETGWATAWRVEDLKEFWGDYDNDDECHDEMD
ncbi:hypothetical protein N7490_002827 [Penicillium lividum]|nr:hypothetical protein N7490_002827 [Penicillium lividum]